MLFPPPKHIKLVPKLNLFDMMKVLLFLCLIPTLIEGQKNVQHTEINISRNLGGIITSPGYPRNYANNVNYTWTMKTGNPKATITFNITDFTNVKYRFSPICDDYLQIKRIQPTFMQIIKRCGEFIPFYLESNGTLFTVTFVSDSTHNGRGFNLSWRVYIPDTTTTTTKLSTTTTKIIATEPKTTTVIKTITTRTTTATTTSITSANMPKSRESQTLTSALMTSITTKQRTYTNDPFKNNTKAYEASTKAHTTVKQEILHITADSTRKISTMLSMQPTTAQKSTIGIPEPALKQAEIAQTVKKIQGTSRLIIETNMRSNTAPVTTQSVPGRNATIPKVDNQTATFNIRDIIYFIMGVCVIEVILSVNGIYCVKQRQMNLRHEENNKNTTHPDSSVSRGRDYEIIQLENVSNNHTYIPQENKCNECTYIEIIEHAYDYAYGDMAPISPNPRSIASKTEDDIPVNRN